MVEKKQIISTSSTCLVHHSVVDAFRRKLRLRPHHALLATAARHGLLQLWGAIQYRTGLPDAYRSLVATNAIGATVGLVGVALGVEVALQDAGPLPADQRPVTPAPGAALAGRVVLGLLAALEHRAGVLGADHLALAAATLQAGVVVGRDHSVV